MPKVFIEPLNTQIEVAQEANLRESLIAAGHEILSPCGGCASCSRCVVLIKEGAENISEISFEEKQLLGNVFHMTKERLSCQTRVLGDIHIDISEHLKKHEPRSQKIVRKTKAQVKADSEKKREELMNMPAKEGGFRKPKSFNYSEED